MPSPYVAGPLGQVRDVLAEAQRIGIIGTTEPGAEIAHSLAFVAAVRNTLGPVIDLGSGGGLPGLVVAAELPHRRVVLTERRQKRADFLRRAVRRLGFEDRVAVVEGEAPGSIHEYVRAGLLAGEEGDNSVWSGAGAVTARSFGPLEVTAAVAAELTAPGSVLAVSVPPGASEDTSPSPLWRPEFTIAVSSPPDEGGAPAGGMVEGRVVRFRRLHHP